MATVEIAEVFTRAECVPAASVAVGDTVFDIWGRQYAVTRVSRWGTNVAITRADDVRTVLAETDTITIIRKGTDR